MANKITITIELTEDVPMAGFEIMQKVVEALLSEEKRGRLVENMEVGMDTECPGCEPK